MIRINLLATPGGRSSRSSGSSGTMELALVLFLIVAGLAAVGFFWYSYEERIGWARHKVRQEEQEVAKLQAAIKMVKKYKATKKLLKKQLEIIDKLKKTRNGPIRVLDELSLRIPKQVWLSGIRQRGNQLVINGEAAANEWVAQFHKRLQDSPYFKSVELKFTFKVTGAVLGIPRQFERIRFSLTCEVTFAT